LQRFFNYIFATKKVKKIEKTADVSDKTEQKSAEQEMMTVQDNSESGKLKIEQSENSVNNETTNIEEK
jgi:hypothetical protein